MILKFSGRIIEREWKKLLLPFLSVALTGMVVSTSFFLVRSANDFLTSKNKEFIGGDIVYEQNREFDEKTLYSNVLPMSVVEEVSKQISFSGLVEADGKSSGASFKIIDSEYPLYGNLKLQTGNFTYPQQNEVYVDETIAKNLNLSVGSEVSFNDVRFIVKGVIVEDPESLLSGFNFLGKVILPQEALTYGNIDLSLFRKEYQTKLKINRSLSKNEIEQLRMQARGSGVRAQFDSSGNTGFQFGLEVVQKFLVIAILIISVLSLVNIYASVNYLANRLRRSFAILISLGMNIKNIYRILFLVNFISIFFGTVLGMIIGYFVVVEILEAVATNFSLSLTLSPDILEIFLIFVSILLTSVFATIPVLNRLRRISPKELLNHGNQKESQSTKMNILLDVIIGILPITFLAVYFLESLWYGLAAIVLIVFTYAGLMYFYNIFLGEVYKRRSLFPFSLKMITAQKKFDGFFGLITFASLFVALTAVYNLSIVRTSIEEYLSKDLQRTLPSVYVLDVQSSQVPKLNLEFPEVNLFPNVRARIAEIDNKDIQAALENNDPSVDRELRREFNLTYRNNLLPSEKVVEGEFKSVKGEVSLEKDFAEKSNIKLGSVIEFNIQGFPVIAKVTSIREVDTRSGYPFFYFILSEEEIGNFPKTFFGYSSVTGQNIDKLSTYLADNIPNATLVNTSSITKIAEQLVSLLLLLILIITIPPLLLSTLLIVTILSTVAKDRKRDGARLMALGKTHTFIRNYYILESVSTTVLSSVFAYIFAVIVSNFIIMKYLKIENLIYFDLISFYIFMIILFGIIITSIFIWRSGNKNLKEYLNYEENN